MSGGEDSVAWLRRRINERLYLARHAIELGNAGHWAELSSGVLMTCPADAPQEGWDGVHALGDSSLTRLMEANDPQDTIARCEAELGILGLCGAHLDRDPREIPDGCHEGRDDDEIKRDEALADLADDVLSLLAGGYRHCDGWAARWACPGCGKALRELPYGHSMALPLDGSGGWTCSDLKRGPVSPEEFIRGADQG